MEESLNLLIVHCICQPTDRNRILPPSVWNKVNQIDACSSRSISLSTPSIILCTSSTYLIQWRTVLSSHTLHDKSFFYFFKPQRRQFYPCWRYRILRWVQAGCALHDHLHVIHGSGPDKNEGKGYSCCVCSISSCIGGGSSSDRW